MLVWFNAIAWLVATVVIPPTPLQKGGFEYFPPLERGDLIVWIIEYYVKNNFKGDAGHDLLEDSQMPLGVNSTAKAPDDESSHIGEGADDAPRIEPF